MKRIKVESGIGSNWNKVAEKAMMNATLFKCEAEFEFNGVLCVVNESTNLEHLYRDYANSWLMDWQTVGPVCPVEYTGKMLLNYNKRKSEKEERERIQAEEIAEKDRKERQAFEENTKDISIELSDPKGYDEWKAKQVDDSGYGLAIFEYAECWAKLMQAEIAKGKTLVECAEQTSFQLGFLGITGFMYGAAVSILSKCWKYGEELRVWHNGKYNHKGDGVSNPAMITVKRK